MHCIYNFPVQPFSPGKLSDYTVHVRIHRSCKTHHDDTDVSPRRRIWGTDVASLLADVQGQAVYWASGGARRSAKSLNEGRCNFVSIPGQQVGITGGLRGKEGSHLQPNKQLGPQTLCHLPELKGDKWLRGNYCMTRAEPSVWCNCVGLCSMSLCMWICICVSHYGSSFTSELLLV